jgi:signal transduction histidine kinase/DNA-binding response OmpR family regulator
LRDLIFWLQQATAVAFVLLGLLVAADWLRRRDRERGFLVAAIVLLAAVVALGKLRDVLGWPVLSALAVAAFIGSGYAVFRFRDSFLPVSRAWRRAAGAAAVLATLVLVVLVLVGRPAPPPLVAVLAVLAILAWALMVGEPILRFWIAAGGRPAVQRARLRSLSLGFAGLVLAVLISAGAGQAARVPVVQVAGQLLALAIVPLLYVSFSPPAWLRREWRAREEGALRNATHELIAGASDQGALATLALDWAIRLVGAESGCVVDGTGNVLAARGMDIELAGDLAADLAAGDRWREGSMLIPLSFTEGEGRLVLVSGPFTPVFGSDEKIRVEQYASAIGPALDRVALLERLRQTNAELEEASRHKSKFLANMSHELRTPLNAILGFSELLMDDEGRLAQPMRRVFLENIHSSGKHLLGLINDILDLAKVEAGQTELYLEPIAVTRVAEDVLTIVAPLAGRKQIALSLAGEAGTVTADAGKVKQMLLNLVSNAIKFTAPGGRVQVTCRRRRHEILIVVSDTGIGIPADEVPRIFEEFEQVEPGPGHTVEGTGLGLALTKRFAELHGGRVKVRSEVGRGTAFTLHLPLEARPASLPTMPPSHVAGDGPLILVVEDNPQAAALMTAYLARGGYQVEVARNGPEALEMAQRLQPEAITLDVLLPDIDGWDVLAALKHDPSTAAIPVVVVTIVDEPRRGRALGAVDYLVKPVEAKTLLAVLGQRHLAPPATVGRAPILIVDDDPLFHEQVAGLLRSEGFSVVSAYGGADGIQRARDEHPAIVILDLMMPGVTGFQVVAALKSDPTTAAIPILVMTAQDLTADDKRWLNSQAAAVLHKPSVAGVDLLAWLAQVLNGATPGGPAKLAAKEAAQ